MPQAGAKVEDQVQDLRLNGHVQGGYRLVGDENSGLQAMAMAMITRCLIPRSNGEDSR